MKIEKITKLSGNRYSAIIDNKKHIIFGDVLLAFNIYKPGDISKENYEKLIKENKFYEGYEKILKFINFKMRSIKEVRIKLMSMDISKEDINKIIEKLVLQGYLDDNKYIRCYINDALNLSLVGPKKIIIDLKKKGIEEANVKMVLDTIDSDIWTQRAIKIANKKQKVAKGISMLKFKQKLRRDFINMGYDDTSFNDVIDLIDLDENDAYDKDREKLIKKYSRKYEGEKLEYVVKQKLYALGYRK